MKKLLFIAALPLLLIYGCGKTGGPKPIKTVTTTDTTTPVALAVSTYAGTSIVGEVEGAASSATFTNPFAIAVDGSGNVYVGDQSAAAAPIRKITPAGVVSGFLPGGSLGLVTDAAGNLYYASLNVIYKVTPAGVKTAYAGTGQTGAINGAALGATFNDIWGIAIDGSGNIYAADAGNNVIRKISAAGTVTTFAGSGTAGYKDGSPAVAEFDDPKQLAVDASGNVYESEYSYNYIRKISPDGTVSTYAGSGAKGFLDGPALSAKFNIIGGIAADKKGNLFVADIDNNRIRVITPAGKVSTFAGSGTYGSTNGLPLSASFSTPSCIAIDASGNVYVTDLNNPEIRKITLK
jgi:hypothetical protein